MNQRVLFRVAGVLWAMWGVLHLVAGVALLPTFTSEVASVPEEVKVMLGSEIPFYVRRTLAEHTFNNAWFGLVVSVGSALVWRGSRLGVFLCAIVGGLAHLGFTVFMVVPGYANAVGVAMTFIAAGALVLSLTAHFGSKARGESAAVA